MWVLLLIFAVVSIDRWMHKNDQMLYTKEEFEQLQREAAERDASLGRRKQIG